MKIRILRIVPVCLFLLFVFQVFANIQYPLLWNDEAETIAFGQSIITNGYPKIDDGKNYLYPLNYPDKTLGVKQPSQAFIGSMWLQNYLAIPTILLAKLTQNIYWQTFSYRLVYAVLGIWGIWMWLNTINQLFKKQIQQQIVAGCLFLVFVNLSLSVCLYIREARYISLVILLSALLVNSLIKQLQSPAKNSRFILEQVIWLWLLFNTFVSYYVIFMIFYFSLFLSNYFGFRLWAKQNLILIVIISLFSIFPLLNYFEIFSMSQKISQINNYNFELMITILLMGIKFLFKFEWGILLFITYILALFNWIINFHQQGKHHLFYLSSSLLWLLMIGFGINIRTPWFFQRYYVALLPLVYIIIILNLMYLWSFLLSKKIKLVFLAITTIVFFIQISIKLPLLEGHLYEMNHPYQGPLDAIIPYLQTHYQNTNKLVIATNYEEYAYMVYLNSRVIVGYTGYNTVNDLKLDPDVIIIRKKWPQQQAILKKLLQKNNYEKVAFDISDSQFNNIAEIETYPTVTHQFATVFADNEEEKTTVYLKKN